MNDVLCRYGRDLRVARLARSCARTPSFVDDSAKNVAGAERAGHVCVDADALAETLGRAGLLREDE